jgi:tetratricopeptide (TPR) repeat protein
MCPGNTSTPGGQIPDQEMRSLRAAARTLLGQGQLTDARELYGQLCSSETATPEDHYRLANILHQQGELEDAVRSLQRAVDRKPDYAEAWHMAGALSGMLGRPEAAADCFEKALALRPDVTETRLNLAQALLQSGQCEAAAEQCARVAQIDPASAAAWSMLGRSHAEMGQSERAIDAFRTALQMNPDFPAAAMGLGFALHRQGRWNESTRHFRHAMRLNPRLAQAHFGLGGSLQKLGRLHEALEHHREAVKLDPRYTEAHLGIGTVLALMGKQEDALPSIREAIRLKPNFVEAYITLAATLLPLGKPEEALRLCEKVLERAPDNIEAIALLSTIDQHMGNIEQAHARLKPLLAAGIAEVNVALAYSTICSGLDAPDTAIELMEQLLEGGTALTVTGRRNLHFNLGKLYDKKNAYAKAFEHYRSGNALKDTDFDPQRQTAEIDAIIAAHTPAIMASLPRSSRHADRPVFVVGMPRSGTSLVEQILASHPAVFGAGELPHVIRLIGTLGETTRTGQGYPRCIRGLTQSQIDDAARYYLDQIASLTTDAARVTDKMPGNFLYLGFLELLFPDARIIHCRRAPLDTCLSCYFQDFSRSQPYSYDLYHLGVFYRNYERLMQHWRKVLRISMIDVQYEDMIADQEAVSRRIIDFCGLPWDNHCLDFHRTQRYVATASYDQVRRPIYTSSVSRWKNYAEFLGPLREELGLQESTEEAGGKS